MPLLLSSATSQVDLLPVTPPGTGPNGGNSDPTLFLDQMSNGTLVVGHEAILAGVVHGLFPGSGGEAFPNLIFGDVVSMFGGTFYEDVPQLSVAALSGGGMAIGWLDSNASTSGAPEEIELRIASAGGTPGAALTVPVAPGSSFDPGPVLASFGTGFALGFESANNAAELRFYDATLGQIGATLTYDAEFVPLVQDLGNGTAVVIWGEEAGASYFHQLYDTATGAAIGSPAALPGEPVAVGSNQGSGFAILFEDSVELYDLSGAPHSSVPSPRQVDYPEGVVIRDASITHLADGGYVIVFTANDATETQTFGDSDVYALHYGPAEELLSPGPQRLNGDLRAPFQQGDQGGPAVTQLADGRLAVAWADDSVALEPVRVSFYDVVAEVPGIVVRGDEDSQELLGGLGGDTLLGFGGNDTIYGFEEADVTYAGDGADHVFGGTGNDTSYGGPGRDTLRGEAGDDLLGGGEENDSLIGGAGDDALWGALGDDTLLGGTGNDTLGGAVGDDSFEAGDGNDEIWAAGGNDTADGGEGNDTIGGADGDDSLSGGSGFGDDEIWGAAGNDTLRGGQVGNDLIGGGTGNDDIDGGAGDDELWGGAGNDTVLGGNGADQMGGGAGNDVMDGGFGRDTVSGGLGDDTIRGGSDEDTLYGGAGDDRLEGGNQGDELWGGAGADVFVFGVGHNADLVADFDLAQGDRLELDDALWSSAGTLTEAQVLSMFSSVQGADLVLDFGAGNVITLAGGAGIAGLDGAIDIV